jgi:hypothetical protein
MSVMLRKYPYPYQAMMAICSDLDETPSTEIYFETVKYLNTSEDTLLGKGVNLEVGNTIYFDMHQDQFSYTNTDDLGRSKIHLLIESGHIDCLHSFGDFVTDRAQLEQYWQVIQSGKRKIEVWVDHGQAITNFDADIMKGEGAIKGKKAYHSDLTVQNGELAFIWKGRVTSIVAQNATRSYKAIFNINNIVKSIKTILLEFIKGWLARLGNVKYGMHKNNNVIRNSMLIDGTPIIEFMRCNPSWGGVSVFDNARGIHQVLTKKTLNTLVKKEGCSVFYSHLGKVFSGSEPFSKQNKQAFKLLSEYFHRKDILVTTTRRLLGYLRTVENIKFTLEKKANETFIYVVSDFSDEDLQGLTWYCDDPKTVRVFCNNLEITNTLVTNSADHTGQPSVSIPWAALSFPNLVS